MMQNHYSYYTNSPKKNVISVCVCVEMVVSCGAKFVCDFSAPKRYLTRGNWQKTLQTRLFKFSL